MSHPSYNLILKETAEETAYFPLSTEVFADSDSALHDWPCPGLAIVNTRNQSEHTYAKSYLQQEQMREHDMLTYSQTVRLFAHIQ